MKLILIEDEPESLMGMKKAVESINMDFILFTSNHPEDALHIIEEQRPELVVTDIMLPYMTGLDLIEEVTSPDYQPTVIVVSGYNDFEYARKSIQVGAVDYLLKPFSTEEFTEKIRKALTAIQTENMHLLETKQQRSFAEIGNRSMRDDYLVDFCLKPTALVEHLYQKMRLWGIEWLANQTFSLLVLDTKGYPDGKPLGREFSLQTFAIGNIVQELIIDYSPSVTFKDSQNRWIVLSGQEDIEGLSATVIAQIKQYQKLPLAVGASSRMSAFEDIHNAYTEALKTFRISSLSAGSDYVYHKADEISPQEDISSPRVMSLLISDREEAVIEQSVSYFIRHTFLSEGTVSKEDMVRKILNYLSQIHVCLSEKTSRELDEIPMKVWEQFDECKTLEESEGVLIQYLINLSREISPVKSNAMVERALKLISARYMEDMTLQIIADELSLHPVWLSQLIKKETGQTYMAHLTETRIERAKALLRETSLKIYEIAESVGYQNLQHFGTIFKKRTGETPKEYRYGK
ncbi:response regulator transcription factor [Paenibacillus agricola]|uniref:Response regulator n=1 Tax=Paenibacillus agricola TaxID=2716264 RepID=A0ABX0JER8_9BACL|nr:response regulator [Paenibacillus agricola]NHN34949.1 response regulator [Paenibacillus agricola]